MQTANTTPDTPTTSERQTRRRRRRPTGLRRATAAAFYGLSVASFDRLNAAGAIPSPIRLGRTLVWNRAELQAHLDHGGPPRAVWDRLWSEIVRHRRTRG